MSDLMTVNEIIKELNISRATLYRMIDEGLPFRIVGTKKKVFYADEVREFIEKRRSDVTQDLKVGEYYTNDEIVNLFKCSNAGNIRLSHSKNVLVLVSSDEETGESGNYWCDDILYFTGQGTEGDQDFEYGLNKTLSQSERNGFSLYLFELFSNQKYMYRGIVKPAGEPFMLPVTDLGGNQRKVCKFPLKPVNNINYLTEEFVEKEEEARQESAKEYKNSRNESLMERINRPISEISVVTKRTMIDPRLGFYVRERAAGKCEFCGEKAPFEYKGEPYLELMHILSREEGGKDNSYNVAALCPNCAARIKKLHSGEDIEKLHNNITKNNFLADAEGLHENMEDEDGDNLPKSTPPPGTPGFHWGM